MPPKRARRDCTCLPFVIFKDIYTNNCFVDEDILDKNGTTIVRAFFENENQEQIAVHVSTRELFALHTLNLENIELWEHMNLKGFFELLAWGPDYMRTFQALTSLTPDNFFTIIGLDGYHLKGVMG